LNSEHSKLEDLSVKEQNLWTFFDNSNIYEFISGETDTLPEFQFNWFEPCQLAVHLPPGVVFASHTDLQPPQDQNKPSVQTAQLPPHPAQPAQMAQPVAQPAQLAVQPAQPVLLAIEQQLPQDQQPVTGSSGKWAATLSSPS